MTPGLRNRGFTLIEAAIVMVAIGILLVAVLQGQQLVDSARYKSLKSDIDDYRTAFNSFQQRYDALPGDFANAENRLGLAAGANGNGNGVIDGGPDCDTDGEEACRSWQHLRAARLISGDDSDSTTNAPPQHAFQGLISAFFSGTDGNGEFGHKLLLQNIPTEFAIRLDEELDDGIHDAGSISCLAGTGCDGPGDWPDVDTGARVSVVYAL